MNYISEVKNIRRYTINSIDYSIKNGATLEDLRADFMDMGGNIFRLYEDLSPEFPHMDDNKIYKAIKFALMNYNTLKKENKRG